MVYRTNYPKIVMLVMLFVKENRGKLEVVSAAGEGEEREK